MTPDTAKLIQIMRVLKKRTEESFVTSETIRILLERHGVFSAAEYQELRSEIQETRRVEQKAAAEQAAQDAETEEQRQFLEAFEGTEQ